MKNLQVQGGTIKLGLWHVICQSRVAGVEGCGREHDEDKEGFELGCRGRIGQCRERSYARDCWDRGVAKAIKNRRKEEGF